MNNVKNVNCSISNVNDKDGLKIIYTNVDQLPNKIDEITLFLDEHDIDVMAVCEVLPKLKKNIVFPLLSLRAMIVILVFKEGEFVSL